MYKLFFMNKFLFAFSLLSIIVANPEKNLLNSPRFLEELIELNLVNANNLIFNLDSKWQFDIEYTSSNVLANNSVYSTSILYKGTPALASCEVKNGETLNCLVNERSQSKYDLIQINHLVTEGATIKWTNLNSIRDIPINTTLKYKNSFYMTLHYVPPSTRYWDFKVQLEIGRAHV